MKNAAITIKFDAIKNAIVMKDPTKALCLGPTTSEAIVLADKQPTLTPKIVLSKTNCQISLTNS